MGRVSNKVALVTGGASGLGEATAEALANEGATVFLTDVNVAQGQAVAARLSNATFIEHDVRDEAAWKAVIAEIDRKHGRLDILFNNAGVVKFGSVTDCTLDDFRFVNAVMAEGTFLGCKTALPLLVASGCGSIINVSSIAAIKGIDAVVAYGAAKGAILSLTRTVAAHCRDTHKPVRCNVIVPGSIRTPMTLAALAEMSPDSSSYEELEGHGQGQPSDVANLLVYLASDESGHMSGATLLLDNGETA